MRDGQKTSVLVLGAGASVAEAKDHRRTWEVDHPPLDLNFFRRAARHGAEPFGAVANHARDLGQPELTQDNPPVSLEEHLGRLYFEMNNAGTEENVRAYFDLVHLYTTELLTTTNWMI